MAFLGAMADAPDVRGDRGCLLGPLAEFPPMVGIALRNCLGWERLA